MPHRRFDLGNVRFVGEIKNVKVGCGQGWIKVGAGGVVVVDADEALELIKNSPLYPAKSSESTVYRHDNPGDKG
jgi:hypothetical protein